MGVKERILQFIESQNISKAEFERRANLSNGYINNFKGGFGEEKLNDVLKAFPSLNRVWLLAGDGYMLRDEEGGVDMGKIKENMLPLLPIEVMAGKPMGEIDSIDLSQCEQYVVPDFIYHGAQMLIRVSGNSMSTRYKNGDILAIKKETHTPDWGHIYVIDSTEGTLIKRIIENKDNPAFITCRSENKALYSDFNLPKYSIRSLYIIIGVIKLVK